MDLDRTAAARAAALMAAAALRPSLTAETEIEGDEKVIVTLATPTNAAPGGRPGHA